MNICVIILAVICALLAVSVIFLLLSMDSLEPLQYGITYNKVTKVVGSEVYESGRYFIGPFRSFITYPENLINIEFTDGRRATAPALQTRTAEGLALGLHVSFQYKLIKNKIPALYNLTYINFHTTYVRISRDIILKVAGNYNATSYWINRQKIGDSMKDLLDSEFKKTYARVVNLQLLKIDLPKTYEDSIVQTQVEVQYTGMREFEQTAELIRQNVSVLQSQGQQEINVVNATGYAEAYKLEQYAKAQAINNTIEAESEVYDTLSKDTGLSGNELSNFLYYDSLMNKKNAKVLVGLENAIVSLGGSRNLK